MNAPVDVAHDSPAVEEGVIAGAAVEIDLTDNLSLAIDVRGEACRPAHGAEVDHAAAAVEECVGDRIADGVRVADDLAGGVDRRRLTRAPAGESSEVGEMVHRPAHVRERDQNRSECDHPFEHNPTFSLLDPPSRAPSPPREA